MIISRNLLALFHLLRLTKPTCLLPASQRLPHAHSFLSAGFASLVISQRWDDKLNTAGDALNFGLTLTGPLKPTVSGLLGPSYTAALHEQTRAAGVAAAAAVRLTATGGH